MKTKLHTLAIAVIGFALIGSAHANNGAASKDTAAKTNAAAAIQQTDQGTFALFDSAKEGTTFAANIEGKGIGTQTANWTGIGTQDNIGATQDNGNTSMARSKTNMTAANGTHKANTTATATHYGTTNVVSSFAALFGGTGQGVFQHCS